MSTKLLTAGLTLILSTTIFSNCATTRKSQTAKLTDTEYVMQLINQSNQKISEIDHAIVSNHERMENAIQSDLNSQVHNLFAKIQPKKTYFICEITSKQSVPSTIETSLNLAEPLTDNIPEKDKLANKFEDNTLSIFFPTDVFQLNELDMKNLNGTATYFKNSPKKYGIIESYADIRGTTKHNYQLSKKRAQAVQQELAKLLPSFNFDVFIHGESRSSKNHFANDRKATIHVGKTALELGFDTINPSNYFLVDGSKSMEASININQPSKWETISDHLFQKGSQVYIFKSDWEISFNPYNTKRTLCPNKKTLITSITPSGATPLVESIGELISLIDSNTNMTVISDGADNFSGQRFDFSKLIKIANNKQVTINTIVVGGNQNSYELLRTLAEKTGGTYLSKLK